MGDVIKRTPTETLVKAMEEVGDAVECLVIMTEAGGDIITLGSTSVLSTRFWIPKFGVAMDWIRTDVFCFRKQVPQYIEEEHLMVMGHREDNRVYYGIIAIPERPDERVEAYKALKEKFNSYLEEEARSQPYAAIDYGLLVEDTIRKYKGFVLDVFPDGE